MLIEQLADPTGVLVRPAAHCGTGVLVLAGSSGRVDTGRATVFADRGAIASSIRWFGDPGQPPGVCEVPLELFFREIDRLATVCTHLAVVGTSYGAEAALLIGAHDSRVNAVVAFAPSSVVWANSGPGVDGLSSPPRSKWTLAGQPLPFVPYDQTWRPSGHPPEFRELYVQSLRNFAERAESATIPVEQIDGQVVCIAGGEDAVWPSAQHAEMIAARRARHGKDSTVVIHPTAGHRTLLPGETPPPPRRDLAHGGSFRADAELGKRAWPHIADALRLQRMA